VANDYPFNEFLRDFQSVSGWTLEGEGSDGFMRVARYVNDFYPEVGDRIPRATLALVASYLAQNVEAFDEGSAAVVGPEASLVSEHLIRAIYDAMVPIALGQGTGHLKPREILAKAQAYSSADPRTPEGKMHPRAD
jgi:hypothetical protein